MRDLMVESRAAIKTNLKDELSNVERIAQQLQDNATSAAAGVSASPPPPQQPTGPSGDDLATRSVQDVFSEVRRARPPACALGMLPRMQAGPEWSVTRHAWHRQACTAG